MTYDDVRGPIPPAPTGGMSLALPVGAGSRSPMPAVAPPSRRSVMPVSGLFSVTLSAMSLSNRVTRSSAAR